MSSRDYRRTVARYSRYAVAFSEMWLPEAKVTTREFSQWAHDQGLLPAPEPEEAVLHDGSIVPVDKDSDKWRAHVQRRNEVRFNINIAAMDSTMQVLARGGPFMIDVLDSRRGALVVRNSINALLARSTANKMDSYTETQRRRLFYILDSTDWDSVPEHEVLNLEELVGDINTYVGNIQYQNRRLAGKFRRLESRLMAFWRDRGTDGIPPLLTEE